MTARVFDLFYGAIDDTPRWVFTAAFLACVLSAVYLPDGKAETKLFMYGFMCGGISLGKAAR